MASREEKCKAETRRKNKATLSASFDLKTVSLLHSRLKGGREEKSNTSGRKCLLFRSVI